MSLSDAELERIADVCLSKSPGLGRAEYEAMVAREPGNVQSHAHLLFLLLDRMDPQADTDALFHQVVWFVENAPEFGWWQPAPFEPPDPRYTELRRLWLCAADAHPTDGRVQDNAIRSLEVHDTSEALRLVDAALQRFPDVATWSLRAAGITFLGAQAGVPGCTFGRAHEHYERFLERTAGHSRRFTSGPSWLGMSGLAAFEAGAGGRAAELASLAVLSEGFSRADERHLGHTVLGRIALRQGDIINAASHLRASLNEAVPDDSHPGIRTRGPSLGLARELLERGERDAVVQYLRQLAGMWERGGRCIAWADAIERGERPELINAGR